MPYAAAAVRELVDAAFSDEGLSTLCFDRFRAVYDQFAAGQTKGQRVRLLVEHAERQRQLPDLLDAVRRANPGAYAEFEPRLVVAGNGGAGAPGPAGPGGDLARQTIDSLAADLSLQNVVKTRKAIRALHGYVQTRDLNDPARELAIAKLQAFLFQDLGAEAVSSGVRTVRQEVLVAIRALATRDLGDYFRDGEFEGQDLYGMNFRDAKLSGVSFKEAFLVESDFSGAVLRGANFAGCHLRNARFHGADLTGADLSGADWFNAPGLTADQLRGAKQPLPPCPQSTEEFHRYLKAHYLFAFEQWEQRLQDELVAAWQEYGQPGGACEAVSPRRPATKGKKAAAGKTAAPHKAAEPARAKLRTVLALDHVGSTRVLEALQQGGGPDGTMTLYEQIHDFIDRGLEAVKVSRRQAVAAVMGDAAILVFAKARQAHRFAEALHAATRHHNATATDALAERWFRVGAATGDTVVKPRPDGGGYTVAGATVTRAVRLQTAGRAGELLVDTATYEALPEALRLKYGAEESVPGAQGETFRARRYVIAPEAAPPGPPEPPPRSRPAPGDRRAVLDLLTQLYPETRLEELIFLIEMPAEQQPARALPHADRRTQVLQWANSPAGCGLARLESELRFLLERVRP
jgi:class 3 adenylate cyclase